MELRELQLYKMRIMEDVISFCERNSIRYFLYGGTLLGAVRHKGFIPWDDDIDLAMLWEDYKKFLKMAPAGLGDRYFVQTFSSDPGYFCLWTQIRVNKTTSLPKKYRKLNIHWGMCIDIFPIIGVKENGLGRQIQYKQIQIAKSLISVEMIKACDESVSGIQKVFMILPGAIRRRLAQWTISLAAKGTSKAAFLDELGTWDFSPRFTADSWKSNSLVPFEGRVFNAPGDPDKVLTEAYGDYMTPPPIEKRGGHELFFREQIIDVEQDYSWYLNHE